MQIDMKLISSLFFFLLSLTIGAQKLICSDQDKKAFDDKIREIQNLKQSDFGDTMIFVGQTFLGTPYVAKTLEIGESESLVINLQGMDCTTYVENVLAFSTLLMEGKMNFDSFASTLENIRYKDGKLDGYASRLHYFSEWIVNNEQKKLLEDVTAEIGGIEIKGMKCMKQKSKLKLMRRIGLCILISFLFYMPVIFFGRILPELGMLMIVGTVIYMIWEFTAIKYFFPKV